MTVVRGELAQGRGGTAADGSDGLPTGRLDTIVTFNVSGIKADAIPFLNIEGEETDLDSKPSTTGGGGVGRETGVERYWV